MVISLDKQKFTCYFDKEFSHKLHCQSEHLNGIRDLILKLGESLEKKIEKKAID